MMKKMITITSNLSAQYVMMVVNFFGMCWVLIFPERQLWCPAYVVFFPWICARLVELSLVCQMFSSYLIFFFQCSIVNVLFIPNNMDLHIGVDHWFRLFGQLIITIKNRKISSAVHCPTEYIVHSTVFEVNDMFWLLGLCWVFLSLF